MLMRLTHSIYLIHLIYFRRAFVETYHNLTKGEFDMSQI